MREIAVWRAQRSGLIRSIRGFSRTIGRRVWFSSQTEQAPHFMIGCLIEAFVPQDMQEPRGKVQRRRADRP